MPRGLPWLYLIFSNGIVPSVSLVTALRTIHALGSAPVSRHSLNLLRFDPLSGEILSCLVVLTFQRKLSLVLILFGPVSQ